LESFTNTHLLPFAAHTSKVQRNPKGNKKEEEEEGAALNFILFFDFSNFISLQLKLGSSSVHQTKSCHLFLFLFLFEN
jgi:hypothetical protein